MRGGKRGRGRSLIPPSVVAAQTSSRLAKAALPIAPPTATRPAFPPPTANPPPDLDILSQLRDVVDYCAHIQTLLKATPFHIKDRKSHEKGDGLERYSDKYNYKPRREKLSAIPTAVSLLPEELQQISGLGTVSSQLPSSSQQPLKGFSYSNMLAKLQEDEAADEGTSEQEPEAEGEADEEVYEEEELEDETDYNLSYFDNGEEYGEYYDGEDGGGGEPSY